MAPLITSADRSVALVMVGCYLFVGTMLQSEIVANLRVYHQPSLVSWRQSSIYALPWFLLAVVWLDLWRRQMHRIRVDRKGIWVWRASVLVPWEQVHRVGRHWLFGKGVWLQHPVRWWWPLWFVPIGEWVDQYDRTWQRFLGWVTTMRPSAIPHAQGSVSNHAHQPSPRGSAPTGRLRLSVTIAVYVLSVLALLVGWGMVYNAWCDPHWLEPLPLIVLGLTSWHVQRWQTRQTPSRLRTQLKGWAIGTSVIATGAWMALHIETLWLGLVLVGTLMGVVSGGVWRFMVYPRGWYSWRLPVCAGMFGCLLAIVVTPKMPDGRSSQGLPKPFPEPVLELGWLKAEVPTRPTRLYAAQLSASLASTLTVFNVQPNLNRFELEQTVSFGGQLSGQLWGESVWSGPDGELGYVVHSLQAPRRYTLMVDESPILTRAMPLLRMVGTDAVILDGTAAYQIDWQDRRASMIYAVHDAAPNYHWWLADDTVWQVSSLQQDYPSAISINALSFDDNSWHPIWLSPQEYLDVSLSPCLRWGLLWQRDGVDLLDMRARAIQTRAPIPFNPQRKFFWSPSGNQVFWRVRDHLLVVDFESVRWHPLDLPDPQRWMEVQWAWDDYHLLLREAPYPTLRGGNWFVMDTLSGEYRFWTRRNRLESTMDVFLPICFAPDGQWAYFNHLRWVDAIGPVWKLVAMPMLNRTRR